MAIDILKHILKESKNILNVNVWENGSVLMAASGEHRPNTDAVIFVLTKCQLGSSRETEINDLSLYKLITSNKLYLYT